MTHNRTVYIFIHALLTGGAERLLSLLSEYLPERYEPTFVVHSVNKSDFDFRGQIINYDLPKFKSKIVFYSYALWRNMQLLAQKKPDIVVSSLQFTDLLVLLSIFFLKLLFIKTPPVVIRIESAREVKPPKGLRLRLLGWLFRYATAFIVVSEQLKEPLSKNFGIAPEKIHCIYNGVKLEDESRLTPYPQRSFIYDIISIGRLTEAKDHTTMLHAIKELVSVHQHKQLRVCIVGGGEKEQQIRALSTELGLNDHITFTGSLPFEQAQPLLLQSRLFLLTSQWEGFGIVIIEAMSKGVPVISTDCQFGPQEILDNGRYGVLAPVGNAKIIAEKTSALLHDEQKLYELSKRSLERVKRFGIEQISQEHVDLFDKLSNT